MQKINFQNLPNTTTPVNATNLNALQTNVENAIPTKTSDLTNDSTFPTYAEGNWTPTIENATVTYTIQNGKYKKINNIVFINCKLRGTITAVASPAYAKISGLPYTPYDDMAGNLMEHLNCCDNNKNLLVRFYNESSNGKIGLQTDDNNAGAGSAHWVAGQGTFYLTITGFYFIS